MKDRIDLRITFENISDEMDLFLDEKNFILEFFEGIDSYENIIKNIKDLRRNKKTLACFYNEFFNLDPGKAITFMGKYIDISKRKGLVDLTPIYNFVKSDISQEILEDKKDYFAKNIYPIIWKENLIDELRKIGFHIEAMHVEYPQTEDHIKITLRHKSPIFAIIDEKLNAELIDNHYGNSLITPPALMRDINRSINQFKEYLAIV